MGQAMAPDAACPAWLESRNLAIAILHGIVGLKGIGADTMTKTGLAPRRVGAILGILATLGAAVLCAGLASPAAAQQTGNANPDGGTAAANQAKRDGTAARKPATTAPTKRTTTTTERATAPDGGSWTLDDALITRRSSHSLTPTSSGTVTERAPIGRVQVQGGTFGIETESKFRDNQFSDGRRVPGLETEKRAQPSYFGLSLSVPTTDKSIIPVPLFPRPE
jgi:hypothetical protein